MSVGMRRPFVLSYPLTCVAFHPRNAVMAVGDQTGRITLCHFNDSGKQQQLLKSELHWHAHSVLALAFSDGACRCYFVVGALAEHVYDL